MMRSGPMIGDCVRNDGVKALPQRHNDTKMRGVSKFFIEIRAGAPGTFAKHGTNGFATSARPRLCGNVYFFVRCSPRIVLPRYRSSIGLFSLGIGWAPAIALPDFATSRLFAGRTLHVL
jgi:hypothetical protein